MKFYLFIIGLVSILGQVVILRELSVAFYGVELIYILALGIWLLWSAVGAATGRRNKIRPVAAVNIVFVVLGILWPLEVAVIRALRLITGAIPGSYLPFGKQLLAMGFYLFFPGVLLGLLFQWAAKLYVASGKQDESQNAFGNTLAGAYAIESAGGVAGGLAATLFPVLGIQNFSQAMICSLMSFLVLVVSPNKERLVRKRVGIAVTVIAVFFIFLGKILPIDRQMTRWNHPNLVACQDTPYGRIAISESGGQFAVFENDALMFETQNIAAEAFVHTAALHHQNPQKFLILGGGFEGLVRECLQYKPSRLDYVELNKRLLRMIQQHLPPESLSFLNSEAVTTHIADPREFVSGVETTYDMIIVGMPPPMSGQTNRFYTREYFQECSQSLCPDGILAIRIPSSENIWTPFLTYRNAGIYGALQSSFHHVLVFPGVTNVMVASNAPLSRNPDELIDRFKQRNLQTRLFTPAYIRYLHTNDRFFSVEKMLSAADATPNSDTHPVCYQYSGMIWLSKLIPGIVHRDISVMNSYKGYVGIFLVFAGCIFLAFLTGAHRKDRSRRILTIFLAAFIGMVMETMFLLYYQSKNGVLFQNIGILLMVFMAGLSAGSIVIHRLWQKIGSSRGGNTGIGKFLFLFFILLNLFFVGMVHLQLPSGLLIMSLFLFLSGFIVSGILAHGSLLGVRDQKAVVSPLYASDLAGGCAGSLAGSLLLVPFLGMMLSAILMIFLSGAGILMIRE